MVENDGNFLVEWNLYTKKGRSDFYIQFISYTHT